MIQASYGSDILAHTLSWQKILDLSRRMPAVVYDMLFIVFTDECPL